MPSLRELAVGWSHPGSQSRFDNPEQNRPSMHLGIRSLLLARQLRASHERRQRTGSGGLAHAKAQKRKGIYGGIQVVDPEQKTALELREFFAALRLCVRSESISLREIRAALRERRDGRPGGGQRQQRGRIACLGGPGRIAVALPHRNRRLLDSAREGMGRAGNGDAASAAPADESVRKRGAASYGISRRIGRPITPYFAAGVPPRTGPPNR
jgi:hypothetical protein